jgi:hypothetical protein
MANVVQKTREPENPDLPALAKDQMQLYIYYRPSLQANNYVISATQTISYGSETLEIQNVKANDASLSLAHKNSKLSCLVSP